jgi:anti-anti-sigma regulatory factor
MTDFYLDRKGQKVSVVVGSELTAAIVPDLRGLLCAIQEDGVTELVLDFSRTTSLDAAGIRLLLATHNSFSRVPNSLSLVQVPRAIFSLLETLRLDGRLHAQTG